MSDILKAIKISDRVYWVGAIDWGLREFHGYATHRGSTYNAYLVMGDSPVLIDTVKAPFVDEMYARIASVVEPKKIKAIISNHAEMDHSGGLPRLAAELKPEKIYASVMGQRPSTRISAWAPP
jgi:flavorubredoxin